MELNIEQRTNEWHMARLGKVTASSLYKVLARTKTGYGADRANYLTDLVLERITGQKTDSYISQSMQHGIDQEPFARAAYETTKNIMVDEVGFILHPTIKMSGCSPDGLVGDDGMVEIKCPDTKTALECWLSPNPVNKKHFAQMQWQLKCADRQWCDYVVFDPRLPAKAQLFIVRIERDDDWIKIAEEEVIKFLDEVEDKVAFLKQITGE